MRTDTLYLVTIGIIVWILIAVGLAVLSPWVGAIFVALAGLFWTAVVIHYVRSN